MEEIGGFTQNAIFIRFCISYIFVRFLMNELDGYEFRQPCKADETFIIDETLTSFQISQLTDMFLSKIRLRSILHLRTPSLKSRLDMARQPEVLTMLHAYLLEWFLKNFFFNFLWANLLKGCIWITNNSCKIFFKNFNI